MENKYFVSYSFVGGSGSACVSLDYKLDHWKHIERLREELERNKPEIGTIVIMFFKELN